jgi:hypothetical protein
VVAAFAANPAGVPLTASIAVTLGCTSSVAIAGSGSNSPAAQRYSIATFCPPLSRRRQGPDEKHP